MTNKKLTNDAIVGASIKFEDKDIEVAKQLLLVDFMDTYNHLKNSKWDESMKVDKQHYLEDTNIAIAAIHFYAEGALECVKRSKCWDDKKIKEVEETINSMRALTIDEI